MKRVCEKDFVHVAPSPDPYRGKYRGEDEGTGESYAEEVKTIINNASNNGRQVSNMDCYFPNTSVLPKTPFRWPNRGHVLFNKLHYGRLYLEKISRG